MYINLSNETKLDFRFNRSGEYHNDPSVAKPFRKATKADRNDLRGKTCPSCGVTRSMMNKCECNS